MAEFEIPEDWTVLQAWRFTLDPTDDQSLMLARHFGDRCKAYTWTVTALKVDIEAWRHHGRDRDIDTSDTAEALQHLQERGARQHRYRHGMVERVFRRDLHRTASTARSTRTETGKTSDPANVTAK